MRVYNNFITCLPNSDFNIVLGDIEKLHSMLTDGNIVTINILKLDKDKNLIEKITPKKIIFKLNGIKESTDGTVPKEVFSQNDIISICTSVDIGTHYFKIEVENYTTSLIKIMCRDTASTVYTKIIQKDFPVKYILCNDTFEINNPTGTELEFQVFSSNNANDTKPVWDNITTPYLNGETHQFSNNIFENGCAVQTKIVGRRLKPEGYFKLHRCILLTT